MADAAEAGAELLRHIGGAFAGHAPREGESFTAMVVKRFEELNARLRADLGPERQVGHSYFMVPDLDDDKLAVVWDHHICPLLSEYFVGQPSRAAAYGLSDLLHGRKHRGARDARRTHNPAT